MEISFGPRHTYVKRLKFTREMFVITDQYQDQRTEIDQTRKS